jgi:hypothetical protein
MRSVGLRNTCVMLPAEDYMNSLVALKQDRDLLTRQLKAINTAITVLSGGSTNKAAASRGKTGYKMSAETRAKLSRLAKARWAKRKAGKS